MGMDQLFMAGPCNREICTSHATAAAQRYMVIFEMRMRTTPRDFYYLRYGRQPYLKQRASLNSSLWRSKPNSLRGRAVSHVDAPLSLATSNNRSRSAGN